MNLRDGIPFGPAFKTDPNAPYDVTSDKLDVDDNAKTALFTGNVVTVQGNFTIRSAEMTAYYTGRAGLAGIADDKSKTGAASLTHIRAKEVGLDRLEGWPDGHRRLGRSRRQDQHGDARRRRRADARQEYRPRHEAADRHEHR